MASMATGLQGPVSSMYIQNDDDRFWECQDMLDLLPPDMITFLQPEGSTDNAQLSIDTTVLEAPAKATVPSPTLNPTAWLHRCVCVA